jgi:hypothetical protein
MSVHKKSLKRSLKTTKKAALAAGRSGKSKSGASGSKTVNLTSAIRKLPAVQ